MIAHLTGTVAGAEANSVILDVNGVGYRVYVPLSVLSVLPETGGRATLQTVMAVREDDISLYGFSTPDERDVFLLLTAVTGVGPKVGLSMLSVYDAGELARLISAGDVRALTRVPGVGPKLAQRIALELGERMAEHAFSRRVEQMAERRTPERSEAFEDVVEALVNLGYSRPDSRRAAERALSARPEAATPELIRDALNLLTSAGRR